eukprot:g1285.t1
MDLCSLLRWREIGVSPRVRLPLPEMLSSMEPQYTLHSPHGETAPNQCQFGSKANSHLLCMADEEGYITLWDTFPTRVHSGTRLPFARWSAHDNTIFDLVWLSNDNRVATASGDQTCKVWDVATENCLYTLRGHQGSVKAVSVQEGGNVLCTGSRDGDVRVWDLRQGDLSSPSPDTEEGRSVKPAMIFSQIHKGAAAKHKRKRSWIPQSVTCVQFLGHDRVIATAGASEGTVRLWDIRSKGRSCASLSHRGGAARGISSLALSARGDRLLANSTDDR